MNWFDDEDAGMRCRPLDSWAEMDAFVASPPPWRTLTRPLVPRSTRKIRNCEVNPNFENLNLENPQSFCHFEEDSIPPQRYAAESLPRTLLCHDMANGYHDDSYVDGTSNWDAYTFYNWAGIDTFCYFSHHLVTIPPLGWINAAHAHGVKVLGTLITEWGEGVEFWSRALASDEDMMHLVSMLTAIASTLRFDGWLLNVENKVSAPLKLVEFVERLHGALHAELPHAELIWYDSVTVDGLLHWQNKLNDNNKAFFMACDGLFVNYSWSVADVAASALAAGGRRHAVYVGVDVWGRNLYGGGMFNTQEAVRVVHSCDLSVAVFAPGWTHEALECAPADPLDRYQQWALRDRALWGSLWPLLHTALPAHLPFATSFCRGQGKKRRHLGEVVSPSGWYNVRHMQYQPNANHGPHGYVLSTQGRLAAASRHFDGLRRLRSSAHAHRALVTPPPSAQPSDTDLTDADTERPAFTEQPAVTEIPSVTERPVVTERPAVTELPAVTERPAVTEGPAVTERPAVTSDPSQQPDNSFVAEQTTTPTKEPLTEDWTVTNELVTVQADNEEDGESEMDTSATETEDVGGAAVARRQRDSIHAAAMRRRHIADDNRDSSPLPASHPPPPPQVSCGAGGSGGMMARVRGAVRAALRPLMACSTADSQHAHRVQTYNSHTHAPPPAHAHRPSEEARAMTSSGRSMLQLPIRLKLGADRTKLTLALVEEERECLEVYTEDSFNGGSCLRIHPSDALTDGHRLSRLFVCELWAHAVCALVVTKPQPPFEEQYLNVLLHLDAHRHHTLIGRAAPPGPSPAHCVYPLGVEGGRFRALQRHLLLHQPAFYVPTANDFGWVVRYYVLSLGSSPIMGVNLRTGMVRGPILLGHFGICPIPQDILRAT